MSDSEVDCMEFAEEVVTINKHCFKITKAPVFYAGIGGAIFPGSSYLATYLDVFFSSERDEDNNLSESNEDRHDESAAENKNDVNEPAYDLAIEIGCGVAALPGLMCCRRNVCNTVVFADLPDVLSQLEPNVELNKRPLDNSGAACPETFCISYDWDNGSRETLAKSIGRSGALKPSLILAADVVYDNTASIMLAKAIGNLYCKDGKSDEDEVENKNRQRVFVGQSSQLPQPWEVFVWELYYVHGLGIKRIFECGPEGQKVPEGVYEISDQIVCDDLEKKYGERGSHTAPVFYPGKELGA